MVKMVRYIVDVRWLGLQDSTWKNQIDQMGTRVELEALSERGGCGAVSEYVLHKILQGQYF